MILRNSEHEVEIQQIEKLDPEMEYVCIFDYDNFAEDEFFSILHIRYEHPAGRERNIALYCDFCGNYEECSVLNADRIVIAKFNTVYMLDILTGNISYKEFKDMAGAYALYKVDDGYIIHGEMEIVKLDFDINEKWTYDGVDMFTSVTGKESFTLLEDRIELYDFEDNHYVIDLNGKSIKEPELRDDLS